MYSEDNNYRIFWGKKHKVSNFLKLKCFMYSVDTQ